MNDGTASHRLLDEPPSSSNDTNGTVVDTIIPFCKQVLVQEIGGRRCVTRAITLVLPRLQRASLGCGRIGAERHLRRLLGVQSATSHKQTAYLATAGCQHILHTRLRYRGAFVASLLCVNCSNSGIARLAHCRSGRLASFEICTIVRGIVLLDICTDVRCV